MSGVAEYFRGGQSSEPQVPGVTVLASLRSEYDQLFSEAIIKKGYLGMVASRAGQILGFKDQYDKVEKGSSVPWFVVACIHSLESDLNFHVHLHNGDPLTDYTKHVPKGRPHVGHAPPFAWYESAIDALKMKSFPDRWDLSGCLWYLESYNGFGYREFHASQTLSPYLWSMTTLYTKGKYGADGKFDPELVSNQIGAAALIKLLVQRDLVNIA